MRRHRVKPAMMGAWIPLLRNDGGNTNGLADGLVCGSTPTGIRTPYAAAAMRQPYAMSSSVPVFASIDLIVNLDDMQKATLKTKAAFCINCRLTFDKAKNGDYCCMITRLLVV